MSHQDPAGACGCFQYLRIGEFPQACLAGGLEVDSRLPPLQPANDAGVQVGVSLESDFHDGRAASV